MRLPDDRPEIEEQIIRPVTVKLSQAFMDRYWRELGNVPEAVEVSLIIPAWKPLMLEYVVNTIPRKQMPPGCVEAVTTEQAGDKTTTRFLSFAPRLFLDLEIDGIRVLEEVDEEGPQIIPRSKLRWNSVKNTLEIRDEGRVLDEIAVGGSHAE